MSRFGAKLITLPGSPNASLPNSMAGRAVISDPPVLLSLHHDDANRHPGDDAIYLATIRAWCLLKDVLFWQGESPVRVSAGAPGSRLRPGGEIRPSRAECRRKEVKQIIAELAPVLRGWGITSGRATPTGSSNQMDSLVRKSLRRWPYRRSGQRPTKRFPFTGQPLYRMDLHRLQGAARYPAQAKPRRSSLSRVPENGMHGLKGGPMAQGRF
jgi:Group II intron, maturase-specific domain